MNQFEQVEINELKFLMLNRFKKARSLRKFRHHLTSEDRKSLKPKLFNEKMIQEKMKNAINQIDELTNLSISQNYEEENKSFLIWAENQS